MDVMEIQFRQSKCGVYIAHVNKHGAILVSNAPEASCGAFVAWDYCHWLKFSREALRVDKVGDSAASEAGTG